MPKRKEKPYYLLSREGKRLRRNKDTVKINEKLSNCEEDSEEHLDSQELSHEEINVPQEDVISDTLSTSSSHVRGGIDSSSESKECERDIFFYHSGSDSYSGAESSDEEVRNVVDSGNNNYHVTPQHQEPITSVQDFLRRWAINKNITISALTDLCVGLKVNHSPCFAALPSDGRTILKTQKAAHQIKDCPPGQYIHIGLRKQLEIIVSKILSADLQYNSMDLLINIDGIPLFNSSPGEFYPILFTVPSVKELRNKVFPVGLYYGVRKPDNVSDFLEDFINELKDILANGINNFEINLLGFCCDTPAKSYILGITSHVGYSSCTRCTIHGETIERRRVFLENDCAARTHLDFVNRTDLTYQPRTTPLVDIPNLDFVHSFVLDYMHLICLGVLRTLLFLWCSGPLPHRISKSQRDILSERLLSMRAFITNDFARKPREIQLIKSWKATELRTFLLYLGPIVLKGLLPDDKYYNFLALHVSSTILLRSDLCSDDEYVNLARQLFCHFVESVKTLYGDMYISHNFHNLIHIVDDVIFFRSRIPNFTLHSVSAFPFENFLQHLKKKVRGYNKPLQQVGRRLGEMFSFEKGAELLMSDSAPRFDSRHNDGPVPAFCGSPQYGKIIFNNYNLTISPPNNCCKLKKGSIVMIENFIYSKELNKMVMVGKKFLKKENFYHNIGCHSSDIGIFKVGQMSARTVFPVEQIKQKCLLLQHADIKVVFPLLHCEGF